MCEILIKARHRQNVDNDTLQRIHQRGDPVHVAEDGYEWGRLETLPDFVVVKIPGVSVSSAVKYLQTREVSGVMIRRTLYTFEIDRSDVPTWVKDSLRNTGEVTLTWNQIKNFIKNTYDGTTGG